MIVAIIALYFISSIVATSVANDYSAKAWQKAAEFPSTVDFPELGDNNVKSRLNVGIGFTGGGSRSYLASTGYLSALTELDLVKNVRYIGGISGGSWFTLNYVYSQLVLITFHSNII